MTKGQVEYLVGEVSEDVLMNEPGMQQLRQRILKKVLQDYTDFLKDRPGNPDVRQQMAGAKRQLGEMWLETGQPEDARGLENQAVAQYESLLREAPDDRELRFGLAHHQQLLAELQVQSGDLGEGKKEVDRGIDLLERLKTEEPGNGDYRIALARGYDLRVTVAGQQGDIEAGLADNQRVLEALVEGISRDRIETAFPRFTGPTLYHLGTAGNGNYFFAGPAHSLVRGVWSDLPWNYLLLLAKAWTNQGVLLSLSGRNAEAARVLEQAIANLRLLVEGCPRARPVSTRAGCGPAPQRPRPRQLGLPGQRRARLARSARTDAAVDPGRSLRRGVPVHPPAGRRLPGRVPLPPGPDGGRGGTAPRGRNGGGESPRRPRTRSTRAIRPVAPCAGLSGGGVRRPRRGPRTLSEVPRETGAGPPRDAG